MRVIEPGLGAQLDPCELLHVVPSHSPSEPWFHQTTAINVRGAIIGIYER